MKTLIFILCIWKWKIGKFLLIKDIERFGKGTGFKIDVMGDKFKVDGISLAIHKYKIDDEKDESLKNY